MDEVKIKTGLLNYRDKLEKIKLLLNKLRYIRCLLKRANGLHDDQTVHKCWIVCTLNTVLFASNMVNISCTKAYMLMSQVN